MKLDNIYKISVIVFLFLISIILFLSLVTVYFEHKTNIETSQSINDFTHWYQDSFEIE